MNHVFSFLAENFDLPILTYIAQHFRCDFLDAILPVLSSFANGGIFWIALGALLFLLPKYRKTGFEILFALLCGLLLCNLFLKPICGRIRPYDYQAQYHNITIQLLISPLKDASFPSGHTVASFESAVVIIRNHKKAGIFALIFATIIAFSRLYLYVHYPSDVLTGILLGCAIGFFTHFICKKISFLKSSRIATK